MGRSACAGIGREAGEASLLSLQGICLSGNKATVAANPLDVLRPCRGPGQLGLTDGSVSAWVSWQPPGAEPYLDILYGSWISCVYPKLFLHSGYTSSSYSADTTKSDPRV